MRAGAGGWLSRLHRAEKPVLVYVAAVHLGALVGGALFPSRAGLAAFAVLYLLTGFGVTVGYHRLLAHNAFRCESLVQRALAVLGLLSGEGPPIFWVAHHRKHHALSDEAGDPHRVKDGFWWAHLGWMLRHTERQQRVLLCGRYAPDLVRDPFCASLERWYFHWHAGLAAVLVALGAALGGAYGAASLLSWGFFVRAVAVLHATRMVDSISHTWGHRPHDTGDDSRNNPLVALLALGDGWHNNHHHAATSANHGHHPWQIDLSYLLIIAAARASALLRRPLVWDVKVYRPASGRIEVRFGTE